MPLATAEAAPVAAFGLVVLTEELQRWHRLGELGRARGERQAVQFGRSSKLPCAPDSGRRPFFWPLAGRARLDPSPDIG